MEIEYKVKKSKVHLIRESLHGDATQNATLTGAQSLEVALQLSLHGVVRGLA